MDYPDGSFSQQVATAQEECHAREEGQAYDISGSTGCEPASTSVNSLKGRKQKTQALAVAPSQSVNLLHQGEVSGQGRPASELPFIAQWTLSESA